MNKLTILESIDDPEIINRLVSRRGALRRGGSLGAAAAVASVPVALAALARSAFAQGAGLPQQIVDALNFALTLEFLEADFYTAGLGATGAISADNRPVFAQISQHEMAHVAFLQNTLGASAVAKPTFDFTAGGTFADVLSNPATFLAVSQAFEDTGVRAYKGQAGELMANDAILTAALQIHAVEARHASEVRRLRGVKGWITGNTTNIPGTEAVYAGEQNTTHAGLTLNGSDTNTEAFDEPLTKAAVLAIVDPFIVGA